MAHCAALGLEVEKSDLKVSPPNVEARVSGFIS